MQGRPRGLSCLTGVPSRRAEEGEELGGLPRDAPPYSCRLEPLGPVKHLDWAAGRHGQDDGSTKLKLEPGKADPFPTAPARGACLPYLQKHKFLSDLVPFSRSVASDSATP